MKPVAFLLLCFVAIARIAAQNPPRAGKVLTPEQQQHRQQFKQYLGERRRLQAQAQQAYDTEIGRADRNGGECDDAQGTREQEECLSKQSETTQADFQNFSSAIRALLALSPSGDDEAPSVGPSGPALTAAQSVAEFDKVEQLWKQYSGELCSAAFHQGGGGTISPVLELECRQDSMRNHMRDLHRAYGLLLTLR
ncbi:MAG TPA: lysozyme inhibitor LprI family protein [Terriglobales bacterium]|nr:lysozyme inhibitor LprI family protein [Terriglobales bacterium]